MADDTSDTFEKGGAAGILDEIETAAKAFKSWRTDCHIVDEVYSRSITNASDENGRGDTELDVFWASYEVMKEAVYARPPVPVVVSRFKDNDRLKDRTAELLERCSIAALTETYINRVMLAARDDLLFGGRAVLWVRHVTDDKGSGHKVCIDHVHADDFLHEPVRSWTDVGWVARRFWLTETQAKDRFPDAKWEDACFIKPYETDRTSNDYDASAKRAEVWELWHKGDDCVYWVTKGVEDYLDKRVPHIDLEGFFPCPEPAYGTLRRETLIPIPDYSHYAGVFSQIDTITSKIYTLLDCVAVKGIIPGGSNLSEAVREAFDNNGAAFELIEVDVSAANLTSAGGKLVEWLPMNEVAAAIQGLFEARAQLINDYYELSGISDIMRGATDAGETLGAQQLKSQYGSVRVRAKSTALQRVAADAVKICAEIIAEKFPIKQILEMAQQDIPTRAALAKQVKDIEASAQSEMEGATQQFAAKIQQAQQSGEQIDPAQTEEAFEQIKQGITQKYAQMLAQVDAQIPLEDFTRLLRDDKARCFMFEIESSSTILTDELTEKATRNEFLAQFSSSLQALQGLASINQEGAELAGSLMKFVLAPYRAGRELEGAIDAFIDSAGQFAGQGNNEGAELAAAQKALADAEMEKARAQMTKVEADSSLKQQELQGKVQQMQMDAQEKGAKFQLENGKLQLQLQKQEQEFAAKMAEVEAKINLMQAQTAKLLSDIGLDVKRQNLEEYKVAEQTQQRQVDNLRAMDGDARAARNEERQMFESDRNFDAQQSEPQP